MLSGRSPPGSSVPCTPATCPRSMSSTSRRSSLSCAGTLVTAPVLFAASCAPYATEIESGSWLGAGAPASDRPGARRHPGTSSIMHQAAETNARAIALVSGVLLEVWVRVDRRLWNRVNPPVRVGVRRVIEPGLGTEDPKPDEVLPPVALDRELPPQFVQEAPIQDVRSPERSSRGRRHRRAARSGLDDPVRKIGRAHV